MKQPESRTQMQAWLEGVAQRRQRAFTEEYREYGEDGFETWAADAAFRSAARHHPYEPDEIVVECARTLLKERSRSRPA